jgi:uncharacterized protein DUF899
MRDARGSFPNTGPGDDSLARLHLMSLRRPGLHSRRFRTAVFHTYSAYARGLDLFNTAHNLDLVPKVRDEEGQGPRFWVRRHDKHDVGPATVLRSVA